MGLAEHTRRSTSPSMAIPASDETATTQASGAASGTSQCRRASQPLAAASALALTQSALNFVIPLSVSG